jgi:hypothetical protein
MAIASTACDQESGTAATSPPFSRRTGSGMRSAAVEWATTHSISFKPHRPRGRWPRRLPGIAAAITVPFVAMHATNPHVPLLFSVARSQWTQCGRSFGWRIRKGTTKERTAISWRKSTSTVSLERQFRYRARAVEGRVYCQCWVRICNTRDMLVCDGFRIGEWDVDNRVLNGEAIRSDCREGICVSEAAVSWL